MSCACPILCRGNNVGEAEFTLLTSTVTIQLVETPIVAANPLRVWVRFDALASLNPVTIWPVGAGDSTTGLILQANLPLSFWYRRHGPIPSYGYSGVNTFGPTPIVIWELVRVR